MTAVPVDEQEFRTRVQARTAAARDRVRRVAATVDEHETVAADRVRRHRAAAAQRGREAADVPRRRPAPAPATSPPPRCDELPASWLR